jgi:hypothetical protein
MTPEALVQLPTLVKVAFLVMLWPAIWAGAELTIAFGGDIRRHTKEDHVGHLSRTRPRGF